MLDHDDATMVLTILSRIGDIYSPHVPHNAGVTDERVPTRDHAPGPHTHTSRSTATYAAEISRSDACLPCTVRRAGPDAARRGSAARPVSCCATCKICVLATWHTVTRHAPHAHGHSAVRRACARLWHLSSCRLHTPARSRSTPQDILTPPRFFARYPGYRANSTNLSLNRC